MNFPKHIQEAATLLTDAASNTSLGQGTLHELGRIYNCSQHLEHLCIWQQEVIDKQQKFINTFKWKGMVSGRTYPIGVQDLDEVYTQLKQYIDEMKKGME